MQAPNNIILPLFSYYVYIGTTESKGNNLNGTAMGVTNTPNTGNNISDIKTNHTINITHLSCRH